MSLAGAMSPRTHCTFGIRFFHPVRHIHVSKGNFKLNLNLYARGRGKQDSYEPETHDCIALHEGSGVAAMKKLVICDGVMYVRHGDALAAFDIKAK